jgi:hypothetical protein
LELAVVLEDSAQMADIPAEDTADLLELADIDKLQDDFAAFYCDTSCTRKFLQSIRRKSKLQQEPNMHNSNSQIEEQAQKDSLENKLTQ